MNVDDSGGSVEQDCNCVFMPYGDGASFSGYRSEPWPVPSHPGRFLTFRVMTNFDQTFAYLFANLGAPKRNAICFNWRQHRWVVNISAYENAGIRQERWQRSP
jgi:hypothetical protein